MADELPAAIERLSNSAARDRAVDAWHATGTVVRCVNTLRHLVDDSATHNRLVNDCAAAMFALCAHGAFTPSFRDRDPNDLISLLPDQFEELSALQHECLLIRSQLAIAPTAALGHGEDVSGSRSGRPKINGAIEDRVRSEGLTVDQIVEEYGKTADAARKIRSRALKS